MMESMFSIQELLDFVLLLPLAFSLLAASGFFNYQSPKLMPISRATCTI